MKKWVYKPNKGPYARRIFEFEMPQMIPEKGPEPWQFCKGGQEDGVDFDRKDTTDRFRQAWINYFRKACENKKIHIYEKTKSGGTPFCADNPNFDYLIWSYIDHAMSNEGSDKCNIRDKDSLENKLQNV